MKKLVILALGMVFLLWSGGWLLAQPAATGFTLSDIYYFIAEGTEGTWGGHNLEPQSGVAGEDIEGFNKNLEDIYYFMADAFGKCNLTATDLAGKGLTGKKYFSPDPENWGVVEIAATPVPSPSPAPSTTPVGYWYVTYGPSGTKDVVEIEGMYVASKRSGSGCANGGEKDWDAASSWGSGLNWLGKTDWRLPSRDELKDIFTSRSSLDSYTSSFYWSGTVLTNYNYYAVDFNGGWTSAYSRSNLYAVRAVRDGN